jgi:hypothetical protein
MCQRSDGVISVPFLGPSRPVDLVPPVEWFHLSPDQVESYYLQVGLAEPKAPSGTTDFRVWIC